MKYVKGLAVIAVVALGSCLLWTGMARAQQVTSASTMVYDKTIFRIGRTVVVDGTVDGDVYCAGQDVTIDATVHGDVICGAQKLHVRGTVDGSVRAAGQDVTIMGKVGHSLSIAAQQVSITKQAVIGQDAVIAGSTVELDGQVTRDVTLRGTNVTISSVVGRDLHFGGSQLTLADGASVKGAVNYTSVHSISIAEHASITGKTTHTVPQRRDTGAHLFGMNPMTVLTELIAFIILCLFLIWFFPRPIHAVSQVAVDGLGRTLTVGLAAILFTPFIIAMLIVTLIGVPLAILLVLFGLLVAILSMPVAAYYFGSMLWAKAKNPVNSMLLGSISLGVIYFIPVAGAIITFVAYLLGSGAILLAAKRHFPQQRRKAKNKKAES